MNHGLGQRARVLILRLQSSGIGLAEPNPCKIRQYTIEIYIISYVLYIGSLDYHTIIIIDIIVLLL